MMVRAELDEAAEEELKKALAKDPRLPHAHFLLGQTALFRGRLDESVALFQKELELNPGDAMAFYRLGDAYSRQLKWDEAIAALQRSVWLNPYFSGPYLLLGRAYMKKGAAGRRRGHVAPGDPVRPQQQGRALPARPAPAAGRPHRRGAARAGDGRAPAGRQRTVRPARAIAAWHALAAARCRSGLRGGGAATPTPWPVRARGRGRARPACATPRSTAGSSGSASSSRPTAPASPSSTTTRDGWLDALVLSGTRLRDGAREDAAWPPGQEPTNRLYRNRRDGTFEDVTDRAGLRRTGWASSVCAGDYDNDGATRPVRHLLRPERPLPQPRRRPLRGRHRARRPRRAGTRWGSGCSFVDYDRDGRLDLFVANYLAFDLAAASEPGQGPQLRVEGHPGQLRAEGPALRHEPALPQPRRRHVRGRLRGVGRGAASPRATR